ncbi:ATP-binding protein OS=Streptomyces alboniger OX=132473 GN=CP975_25520 PE=3 SV=1 [Streptomyces alboniger]
MAINQFDNSAVHTPEAVREALDQPPDTPVVTIDARDKASSVNALITMVRYLQKRAALEHA